MLDDLYGGQIMQAAAAIPPERRLPAPDATSHRVSRVCGSELTLDLKMEGDVIADFGLDVQACALGQAAASLISRNLIGAGADELFRLHEQMTAMLKQNAPPPGGERWKELAALQPIRDYPQRHRSTLLMVEAIVECLEALGFEGDTGIE